MLTGIITLVAIVALIVCIHRSGVQRLEGPLGGVCAGLAQKTGLTPLLARVIAVLALVFTGGLAVVVYVALWVSLPKR